MVDDAAGHHEARVEGTTRYPAQRVPCSYSMKRFSNSADVRRPTDALCDSIRTTDGGITLGCG